MNKACNRCHQEKPITEFCRNSKMADGYLNQCRACRKDIKQKYSPITLEKRRIYRRRYIESHPGIRGRMKQRFKEMHPDRYEAHMKVSSAIKNRKLIKEPCEVCGSEKVEAHHDDYSKPLDVRWLCRPHHMEHHAKANKGAP